MKNSVILRSLTLLLGVFLALVIFAQLFHLEPCDGKTAAAGAATEQTQDEQNGDETVISLPSFSIPSPVSVQPALDSYILFEILLGEETADAPVVDAPLIITKLFSTLFTTLIAPNAP